MLVILNYLDIVEDIGDGILVETCKDHSELNGLFLVCRKNNEQKVLELLEDEMGNHYSYFIQQLKLNSESAFAVYKAHLGVTSLVDELIDSCGGIENVLTHVKRKNDEVKDVAPESQTEDDLFDTDDIETDVEGNDWLSDEPEEEFKTLEELEAESEIEEPFDGQNSEAPVLEIAPEDDIFTMLDDESEESTEQPTEQVVEQAAPATEQPVDTEDDFDDIFAQDDVFSDSKTTESPVIDSPLDDLQSMVSDDSEQSIVNVGQRCEHCIYDKDGVFKGFTEGQRLTMLNKLHELDKEIALGTLNPEYVLNKDELDEAKVLLESYSSGAFKSFFIHYVELVRLHGSEADFMRISNLLDEFITFAQSFNRE